MEDVFPTMCRSLSRINPNIRKLWLPNSKGRVLGAALHVKGKGACSFLQDMTDIEKGGNNGNDRAASPEVFSFTIREVIQYSSPFHICYNL